MTTARSSDADERYRRLIERSGVGLFHTRVDGGIVWANIVAAKLVGYDSVEEFLDNVKDIRQIYVDPSRRDQLLYLMDRNGFVSGFEYEMRRRDGNVRWISLNASEIRGPDGTLEGFEGTFVDVTERKLLEAATVAISSNLEPTQAIAGFAEVLQRAVSFRQLSLVLIEGDHYRRLVSYSHGGTAQRLKQGESVPMKENSVEVVVRTGQPLIMQDTGAGEYPFDRVLAEAGVGSYGIFPLVDDTGVFATLNVGLPEPHTFGESTAELLTKISSSVAQAVKNIVLYEKQKDLVQRLEEVGRLKNEFLASVSHDLRNPVSVMTGVVDLLEREWDNVPDDRKRQMLRSLSTNSRLLRKLMQRDLDVALMELGELRYEIEPFDLGRLVSEIVETFRESGSGRTFALEVEDGLPEGLGDRERQSQILHNLLSNAVKFSPKGTTVTVRVRRAGDELEVSVTDEGGGIDPADAEQLFKRLARLEAKTPGTGLGLYMARSMVEAQGGRIWVESQPGFGSRFAYTVPASA